LTQLKPEEVETPCLACFNDKPSLAAASGCKAYVTDDGEACEGYETLKLGVDFSLNPFKGEPLRVARLWRLVFNLNEVEENIIYTAVQGGGLTIDYILSDAATQGARAAKLLTVASAIQRGRWAPCFKDEALKLKDRLEGKREGGAALVIDPSMPAELKALTVLCILERLKEVRVGVGCGYVLEPLASTPEGRAELKGYVKNAVVMCGSTAPFRRMLHAFNSLIVNPHIDDEWVERVFNSKTGRGPREGLALLWRRSGGNMVERAVKAVKHVSVKAELKEEAVEKATLLERLLGGEAGTAFKLMSDMVTHAFTVETALGYLQPFTGGAVESAAFIAKLISHNLVTREVGVDRVLYLKLTPRGLIAVKEYEAIKESKATV